MQVWKKINLVFVSDGVVPGKQQPILLADYKKTSSWFAEVSKDESSEVSKQMICSITTILEGMEWRHRYLCGKAI